MSNSRLALRASFVLAAGLACLSLTQNDPASAQTTTGDVADIRFDPAPAPGDLALPMPGGLKMVFRAVRVAGGRFWGDPQRLVTLGNAETRLEDADIFETPREVMVSGSFRASDGESWLYFLGKYEVSKAQVAAVLGEGDLAAGIRALAEISADPDDRRLVRASGLSFDRLLAKPAAWLSHADFMAFIDRYNAWCFADPACLNALPRVDDVPGYIRLPTEVEWEYAARGGYETAVVRKDEALFSRSLPFPEAEADRYAWAAPEAKSRSRRIGSLEPVFGFHDLLGNVQELMADPFRPELGQGKPGALTARGGSFLTHQRELRTSHRSEVEIYRWTGDAMVVQRSPTTGLRLAIGAPVIASDRVRQEIAEAYRDYREDLQRATPAGASQNSPFLQAATPLTGATETVEALLRRAGTDRQTVLLLNRMRTHLIEARDLIGQGLLTACIADVRQALKIAGEVGFISFGAAQVEGFVAVWEELARTSKEDQAYYDREQRRLDGLRQERADALAQYADQLRAIDRCGTTIAAEAVRRVDALDLNDQDSAALTLVSTHLKDIQNGRVDLARWQTALTETLAREEFWTPR